MRKSRAAFTDFIRPLSAPVFYRRHWPRKAGVFHGPLDRFGDAARVADVEELLRRAGESGAPVFLTRKGERLADHAQGLAAFEAGEPLSFFALEDAYPVLRRLADALAVEFGLASGEVFCGIFASPPGGVVPPHFDPEPRFNLQLKGTKHWRVAANRSVESPLGSHIAGKPSEVESYARPSPRLDRMPPGAKRVVMRPGSVLFLPSGYWHETRGDDSGSVSVVFTLAAPSWRDMILRELRGLLTKDPRFRGRAFGLQGTAGARRRLRSEGRDLIAEAARLAASIEPEAIVPASTFRWAEGARRSLAPAGRSRGVLLRVRSKGDALRFAVEEDLVPFVRWLVRQKGSFEAPRDEARFGVSPAVAQELLLVLAASGVLAGA